MRTRIASASLWSWRRFRPRPLPTRWT